MNKTMEYSFGESDSMSDAPTTPRNVQPVSVELTESDETATPVNTTLSPNFPDSCATVTASQSYPDGQCSFGSAPSECGFASLAKHYPVRPVRKSLEFSCTYKCPRPLKIRPTESPLKISPKNSQLKKPLIRFLN